LKSSFSIKKPFLKMKDYDFSIQDFVQGYLLQFVLPVVLRILERSTVWGFIYHVRSRGIFLGGYFDGGDELNRPYHYLIF